MLSKYTKLWTLNTYSTIKKEKEKGKTYKNTLTNSSVSTAMV
jgi:hypothetical protein